jgi:hypothetical protein
MVHVYKPRVATKITLADSEATELRIRSIDLEANLLRRATAAKLRLLRVEKTSLKAWLSRHGQKLNGLVDRTNSEEERSVTDGRDKLKGSDLDAVEFARIHKEVFGS